jgi:hypothetical protein
LSDTSGILRPVSEKKRDNILFETPKASLPPSVQALMKQAEERMKVADEAVTEFLGHPFEIYLYIRHNSVRFSMPGPEVAAPALAKSIIKAVQEYEVESVEMAPKEFASNRVGESKIKYDRYVCFDWLEKKIKTNFPPNDGQAFLGAMAIIVEELQGGSAPKETKKS